MVVEAKGQHLLLIQQAVEVNARDTRGFVARIPDGEVVHEHELGAVDFVLVEAIPRLLGPVEQSNELPVVADVSLPGALVQPQVVLLFFLGLLEVFGREVGVAEEACRSCRVDPLVGPRRAGRL